MVWHEVDDKELPNGVISVDKAMSRVTLGVSTVRAWGLQKFRTATPLLNSVPGLVAIQLYEDDRGRRVLMRMKTSQDTLSISCQVALGIAGAVKGRYLARREADGLIMIDFSRKLPPGWLPQAQKNKERRHALDA